MRCSRLAVWREILRTRWVALAAVLCLIGALHAVVGWDVPGLGAIVHGDVWLILLLLALLIAALEGSHRAVARREQELGVRRQQVERLIAAGRPPPSGDEYP
jgi:hypothetical protein